MIDRLSLPLLVSALLLAPPVLSGCSGSSETESDTSDDTTGGGDTTTPEEDATEPPSDVQQPDTGAPDTAEPDTLEPDATEPGPTEPDVSEPSDVVEDATEPDPTDADADPTDDDADPTDATDDDAEPTDAEHDTVDPTDVLIDTIDGDVVATDIIQPDGDELDTLPIDTDEPTECTPGETWRNTVTGRCVACSDESPFGPERLALDSSGFNAGTGVLTLELEDGHQEVVSARVGFARINFFANNYFLPMQTADATVEDGVLRLELADWDMEFEGFLLQFVEVTTSCGTVGRTRRILVQDDAPPTIATCSDLTIPSIQTEPFSDELVDGPTRFFDVEVGERKLPFGAQRILEWVVPESGTWELDYTVEGFGNGYVFFVDGCEGRAFDALEFFDSFRSEGYELEAGQVVYLVTTSLYWNLFPYTVQFTLREEDGV